MRSVRPRLLLRITPLLAWLAALSMVTTAVMPSPASASPPLATRSHRAPSASAIGELDAVAATSNGILAVGTNSLYSTQPPCGQVFHEASASGGWQATYPANRGGRSCAWRAGVAADPRGGAWAVGYYIPADGNPRTLTEHFSGGSWSVVPSPTPGAKSVLSAVVVGPNRQVWAVGQYVTRDNGLQVGTNKTLTMVNSGSGWRVVSSPNLSSVDNGLNSVAVSAAGQVWAVGWYQDTTQFSNHTLTMVNAGSGWQLVKSPSPGNTSGSSGNTLTSVAAGRSGALWAVGYYTDSSNRTRALTMSYGSNGWTVVPSPSPGSGAAQLRAVLVAPDGRIWAAGFFTGRRCGRTLSEVYSAGSWRVVHSPNPHCTTIRANALNGLAVDRRGVLYAVGDTNITTLILTNTGSGWHVAAG